MDISTYRLDAWLEFGLVSFCFLPSFATDASALVQNFALLIAMIFIKILQECFQKGHHRWKRVPYTSGTSNDCFCIATNHKENDNFSIKTDFVADNQTYSYSKYKCWANIF